MKDVGQCHEDPGTTSSPANGTNGKDRRQTHPAVVGFHQLRWAIVIGLRDMTSTTVNGSDLDIVVAGATSMVYKEIDSAVAQAVPLPAPENLPAEDKTWVPYTQGSL